MSCDHYRDPLPHHGDCWCHICRTCGAGLREEDIWRDPDHDGVVRRRRVTDPPFTRGSPLSAIPFSVFSGTPVTSYPASTHPGE